MKKLMISHNCGMSYREHARAEDAADFAEQIDEAEANMLRWYIENDGGDIDTTHVSFVHRKTIEFIESLAARNKRNTR